jgi:hypothetical protein
MGAKKLCGLVRLVGEILGLWFEQSEGAKVLGLKVVIEFKARQRYPDCVGRQTGELSVSNHLGVARNSLT